MANKFTGLGNYSNFSGSMGTMFGTMDAGWFSSNPLVDINPRSNCYRDKHDKPNKKPVLKAPHCTCHFYGKKNARVPLCPQLLQIFDTHRVTIVIWYRPGFLIMWTQGALQKASTRTRLGRLGFIGGSTSPSWRWLEEGREHGEHALLLCLAGHIYT